VADEVLFQARVLPSAPCSSLSDKQLDAVHAAVLRVCSEACACQADSSRFPTHWLFHHRWQKLTSGSMASPIGRIHFDTVAGRTTAFLPTLQLKGDREAGKATPAQPASAARGKKRPVACSGASAAISSVAGEGDTSGAARAGADPGADSGGKKRRALAKPVAKVDAAAAGFASAESGTAPRTSQEEGGRGRGLAPMADAAPTRSRRQLPSGGRAPTAGVSRQTGQPSPSLPTHSSG